MVAIGIGVYVIVSGSGSTDEPNAYPADGGVLVTDAAGHFAARFPASPELDTAPPVTIGSDEVALNIAGDTATQVVVEEAQSSAPVPVDQYDAELQSAVAGFTGQAGMSVTGQQATSFRGYRARLAYVSLSGRRYTFLAFVYDGSRYFALFAPRGPTFETLEKSFQVVS